jgi:hypothetical protein
MIICWSLDHLIRAFLTMVVCWWLQFSGLMHKHVSREASLNFSDADLKSQE